MAISKKDMDRAFDDAMTGEMLSSLMGEPMTRTAMESRPSTTLTRETLARADSFGALGAVGAAMGGTPAAGWAASRASWLRAPSTTSSRAIEKEYTTIPEPHTVIDTDINGWKLTSVRWFDENCLRYGLTPTHPSRTAHTRLVHALGAMKFMASKRTTSVAA